MSLPNHAFIKITFNYTVADFNFKENTACEYSYMA